MGCQRPSGACWSRAPPVAKPEASTSIRVDDLRSVKIGFVSTGENLGDSARGNSSAVGILQCLCLKLLPAAVRAHNLSDVLRSKDPGGCVSL
jgi:hypothetical protein